MTTNSRKFDFADAFETLTGHPPFPWQAALFKRFTEDPTPGHLPQAASIPTGLGKTSVIAVWLLAWFKCPERMPRRLAYVVNRRTVVDQTTREVERIRDNLGKLAWPDLAERISPDGLAISTLRGQHADNRAWSADPGRPAVVCGTVDMIGSRLLFSGYRAGFKTRPMQAALLGCDTLLVHDEAHLEPAFQATLDAVIDEQASEAERRTHDRRPLPFRGLQVMCLSATQRSRRGQHTNGDTHALSDADKENPVVHRRLNAAKRLVLHTISEKGSETDLIKDLTRQAVELAGADRAVLLFARQVKTVDAVAKAIQKALQASLGKPEGADRLSLLIGPMRGHERERLASKDPVFARFVPQSDRGGIEPRTGPVFLICSAAGEVGVNLSADHLVCDLTPLDSMIQRFGRVNRFGDRDDAEIHTFAPALNAFGDKGLDRARGRTRVWLDRLAGDASPSSLEEATTTDPTAAQEAFTPPPTLLPCSPILFDAWAMTSLVPPLAASTLPGCPPVAPYLHGVAEWEPPQTKVAWRHEVECFGEMAGTATPDELIADYPLKPQEWLTEATDQVVKTLRARLAQADDDADFPVWIVPARGKIEVCSLRELITRRKNALIATLAEAFVLLSPAIGMLNEHGRLNDRPRTKSVKPGKGESQPEAYDVADHWAEVDGEPRRARGAPERSGETRRPPGMRLIRNVALRSQTGDPDAAMHWRWYARHRWADDDGSLNAGESQQLDDHLNSAEAHALGYANALGLEATEAAAVRLAAKWHDLGKNRERWQLAIGNHAFNPSDETSILAKSGDATAGGASMVAILAGYRHEFGSMLDLLHGPHEEFTTLPPAARDLLLHLIAAHHGRGRPHFPAPECHDTLPGRDGAAAELLAEVPRRYARLQRRYGRWNLAFLESLVRAADYAASAPTAESAPASKQERGLS